MNTGSATLACHRTSQAVTTKEDELVPPSLDTANFDHIVGSGQTADTEEFNPVYRHVPSPRMHKKPDETNLWMSEEQIRIAYQSLKLDYNNIEKMFRESELKKSMIEAENHKLKQQTLCHSQGDSAGQVIDDSGQGEVIRCRVYRVKKPRTRLPLISA
ncbi:hypothetical protein DXG01_014924 [Tephrocybe rancida]|nr:hypothetical protein DXG01_014924 [Tephrocybe rancida]